MLRTPLSLLGILALATSLFGFDEASPSIVDQFERKVPKQPKYEHTPKYALLLIGQRGQVPIWMVEDGRRLYIDQNANGDLTDDGPPLEPSDYRQLGNNRWDYNYRLPQIVISKGSRLLDIDMRRWNYDQPHDSYGLSLSVDQSLVTPSSKHIGHLPMYAGWFGSFWSADPKSAPVLHFGGRLAPTMLREKMFVIGSGTRRLSMALVNPGSGRGAATRLSIEALPQHLTPRLIIDWPTPANTPPLQTAHDLVDRCCYWEFYTPDFKVPAGVAAGVARVRVAFPDFDLPFELATSEMEVPVVSSQSLPAEATNPSQD